MKLPKPESCLRESGGGNFKTQTALGEALSVWSSDRSSTLLGSTKRTLLEHLLFQRRLCDNGVAVMATTKKRGSRFCALTLVLWSLCVCVLLLCFLPFREFLLPLFAVIVFAYLGHKETGKGFYDGRRKFNIIFIPFNFLICQIAQLPNIQFSRHKSFSFHTPFLRCVPSLDFQMRFRWALLHKLPLPLICPIEPSTSDSLRQ